MTNEIQELRERFRDQMPGLAIFDALAAKYDRLLAAQTALDQQGRAASPERVQALRQVLQEIADTPGLPSEIRTKAITAIKGDC